MFHVQTPALLIDEEAFASNLATMATVLPGERLRPHVKAHKCTQIARQQSVAGHTNFTCATVREMEVMARAGLGADLLLANEVLDCSRLTPLIDAGSRVTVAVDSTATIDAASRAGVPEVLIDVNVGLPRCGCDATDAGRLADHARGRGLTVRGVMGYEGHAVGLEDRERRQRMVDDSMATLTMAHGLVGGDVVSAGGTGSFDLNTVATEIQAGSYALMDAAYGKLDLPFQFALTILATVISVNRSGWAVADCGLKALGMDHGNPSLRDASVVKFCSDEHIVFSPADGSALPNVGSQVEVIPAHVDPTVAYHERMHVVDRDRTQILDSWPIDMRGW
jgi:D-threonine aldolase